MKKIKIFEPVHMSRREALGDAFEEWQASFTKKAEHIVIHKAELFQVEGQGPCEGCIEIFFGLFVLYE